MQVPSRERNNTIANKIGYAFRTSKFGNSILKFLRNFKSKNVGGKKARNGPRITIPVRLLLAWKYKILIVLGGILFTFLLLHLYHFLTIKINPLETSTVALKKMSSDETNLIFWGFDSKDQYKFVEFISLISVNSRNGDLRIYTLNPNIIISDSGKKYTLRTFWNNIDESQDKPAYFSNTIETLLGIRVDRYISFDINSFKTFVSSYDVGMRTIDNYKSDNGFYRSGDYISGDKLSDYLFSKKADTKEDSVVQRHGAFVSSFLENYRSFPFFYRLFWNSDTLNKTFYSNLSRDELVDFFTAVSSAKTPFKTGYSSIKSTIAGTTGIEDALIPDYITFDESIQKVFSDISIMQEQAKIEVFNATKKSGLANKTKRIFQNWGAYVIKSGNYFENIDKNIIYVPNNNAKNFVNNIAEIKRFFRDDIEVVQGEYKYNYSGDLIVVIGKEF